MKINKKVLHAVSLSITYSMLIGFSGEAGATSADIINNVAIPCPSCDWPTWCRAMRTWVTTINNSTDNTLGAVNSAVVSFIKTNGPQYKGTAATPYWGNNPGCYDSTANSKPDTRIANSEIDAAITKLNAATGAAPAGSVPTTDALNAIQYPPSPNTNANWCNVFKSYTDFMNDPGLTKGSLSQVNDKVCLRVLSAVDNNIPNAWYETYCKGIRGNANTGLQADINNAASRIAGKQCKWQGAITGKYLGIQVVSTGTANSNILNTRNTIAHGEYICSPNRKFKAIYGVNDSSFKILASDGTAVWTSTIPTYTNNSIMVYPTGDDIPNDTVNPKGQLVINGTNFAYPGADYRNTNAIQSTFSFMLGNDGILRRYEFMPSSSGNFAANSVALNTNTIAPNPA